MTEPLETFDAIIEAKIRCAVERATAPLEAKVAKLEEQIASTRPALPRCITVTQACREFSMSRSVFERDLADPSTGLRDVVIQRGPKCKIRVPMDAFAAWLRDRAVAKQGRRRQDERAGEVLPTPRRP